MAEHYKTFSESWYRIADKRVQVRPDVRINKQYYRGEKWYVLHDPCSSNFFRLRPAAYEFTVRLTSDRTVEEVWKECLQLFGEDAPGQEEALNLLAQFYNSNLLQGSDISDSEKLFQRFRKHREQEIRGRLMSFMFPRITLLDPEWLLKKVMPLVSRFISPLGTMIWIGVMMFAVKRLVDDPAPLFNQAQAVLEPHNLVWLYVALVITKVIHEFGHAFFCSHYGGEVHRMGVMFLVFTPLPFIDVTSSWSFRSRKQRLLVAASGMFSEFFVAACAAIVWSYTAPGLLHALCYNIMFIASVSTLLFNINPLLRFDGYYILSDLLDIPNLHARSTHEIKAFFERVIFGVRSAYGVAAGAGESLQLMTFAVLSTIYRLLIFSSIILFVYHRFYFAGILLAFFFVVAWILVPLGKFAGYLLISPRLERTRTRALAVTGAVIAGLVVLLNNIPLPSAFSAPGRIEAELYTRIYSPADAKLEKAMVKSGQLLKKGDLIAEFSSRQIDLELDQINARLDELNAWSRKALINSASDREPIEKLKTAVLKKKAQLEAEKNTLKIFAPHDGCWIGGDLSAFQGTWIRKATELGALISDDSYLFSAVVTQDDASRLFGGRIRESIIKLKGQGEHTLRAENMEVVPMEQSRVSSLMVRSDEPGSVESGVLPGAATPEPFFIVSASVIPTKDSILMHGIDGRIRFRMPPETLTARWHRKFVQLIRKRYQQ